MPESIKRNPASTLDPEVKARWVAALRSGDYKQAKKKLKTEQGAQHCCLGVLCDLFAKDAGMESWGRDLSDRAEPITGCDSALPGARVSIWSGLNSKIEVTIGGHRDTLYQHNDRGTTFSEIADAIEAQL